MSNVHFFIVCANAEDFRGGGKKDYTVHDFESDAIDAAKRWTDNRRMPHDIYEVTLVGSTSVPQPKYHSRRPYPDQPSDPKPGEHEPGLVPAPSSAVSETPSHE
jgi:hypothetical protein